MGVEVKRVTATVRRKIRVTATIRSLQPAAVVDIPSLTCQELNDDLTDSQRQVIQRTRPIKSGQTTSFRTGDDGDLEEGRLALFMTLDCNNGFGNTNRFTDELGTQTYTADIIVDWATGLMWFRSPTAAGSSSWNDAIDGALAAVTGGFSDWFLPNVQQLTDIANFSVVSVLDYAPFNILVDATNKRIWTSTTNAGSTSDAWALLNNDSINPNQAKTDMRRYIYCRNFTLADLGL